VQRQEPEREQREEGGVALPARDEQVAALGDDPVPVAVPGREQAERPREPSGRERAARPPERLDEGGRGEDDRSRGERPGQDLQARATAALRIAAVVTAGVAVAAGIGGAGFVLETLLPRPGFGDRLAVSLIRMLDREKVARSVVVLGDARFAATCRQISRADALVAVGRRDLVRVSGTHVVAVGTRLVELHVVSLADLAGCPRLIAAELARRLRAPQAIVAAPTIFNGVPAYRLTLARRPHVVLLVTRKARRPFALVFTGERLRGWSELSETARPAAPRVRRARVRA
jgi:hypothetical protein